MLKILMKIRFRKEDFRMPRGDGAGPMGFGPVTGRGAGNSGIGGGRALGGRRRGYRNMYYRTGLPKWARPDSSYSPEPYSNRYAPEYEKDLLKSEAKMLKQQLKDINNRLEELEEETNEEHKE